ncbi:MAG: hypothetical protein IKO55_05605 [Kiritimatiellae bacterium]|nr:hypothetical protein [Kiritimatiellia bacterium]
MINSKILFLAAVAAASGMAEAARPIARWDVVPHQRIDGIFKAGVVAFHEDGVKVEFDVAGKKFVADAPKLNNRTGVWEFYFPINVSELPDGPISVKATAISLGSASESFELPGLPLYANSGKTQGSRTEVTIGPEDSLAEAISRAGDGGTVYLKKGTY